MLKSKTHLIVAWGIFIAIVGGYILMAAQFPLAYIVATYEDLVGEWAQVFLFATTMALSFKVALNKSRYRFFFAVLALACFYVVGEEISWGQRIFDVSTPEFFKQHNLQNETNLHNFLTGPISTWTKKALEYGIAASLIGYGLLYPYLVRLRWRFALWLVDRGLPFPPFYLWPFFVLSGGLELGLLGFNEAEVAEVLIPLALAIMTLNYLLALRQQKELPRDGSWEVIESVRLARQTVATVVCVFTLALATTAAGYASPTLDPKIESRYMNGVEKFADRYKRHEKWDIAATLYQLVLEKKPQQTDVLRNLYRCYRQIDEQETAQQFLKKAEDVDFEFLQKNPYSVATNLSLVRTYKLMKKTKNAQNHLRTALSDAKLRVQKDPENAAAIYWLGKAHEIADNRPAALQAFQQATKLQPDTLRFQKAALRLGRALKEDVVTNSSAD